MKEIQLAAMREARETLLIAAANFGGLAPSARDRCIRSANALHEAYTPAAAPLLTHKADAEPSNMVQAERDRCAAIADDEAAIREKAGLTHPEDSPARDRCFAGARAAANVARGIRNGEVLETHKAEDAPSDAELLDSRGNIRSDLKSSAYCVGNEYKPFHPSASHVRPEWRDGWNACFVAAIAQERKA